MNTKPKRKKTGGRVKHVPPLKRKCVTLTDEQASLLRKWGRGDLSAGLRWLIDTSKLMICRPEDLPDYLRSSE